MKKRIQWRFGLIGATPMLATVFSAEHTVFREMPDWWTKNMPDKGIALGA